VAILDGKVAVVLGAATASNMGQAIAAKFASEGAAVMSAGRDQAELERFSARIGGAFRVCDITRESDLSALFAETKSKLGGLDIAVNATGVNLVKPFLQVERVDLDKVIGVQILGTFQFLQAVLREISDGGSIIQISSVSAYALLPNHAAYMASKAAGDVLVRAVAAEFGHRGIRVNSIAPGPTVDTPMAAAVLADECVRARISAKIPLGRLGTADDVAEAALWLASDGSFITGEVLQVSGGRAIPQLS
jgi:NAD(P)-dependent dehydrogenase (short-subunit alcohol dehydrogenase family)